MWLLAQALDRTTIDIVAVTLALLGAYVIDHLMHVSMQDRQCDSSSLLQDPSENNASCMIIVRKLFNPPFCFQYAGGDSQLQDPACLAQDSLLPDVSPGIVTARPPATGFPIWLNC